MPEKDDDDDFGTNTIYLVCTTIALFIIEFI